MNKSAYSVAVVGATGIVGREILTVLAERQFPLSRLDLYASVNSAGDEAESGALSGRVELLDAARFDDTDIAFFAAGERVSAEWIPRATESGAVVIDTSQLFAADADVPLVVPEVNAGDVDDYGTRNLIVSPDAPAIALAVVLHALQEALPQAAPLIIRVVASILEPASGAGRAGIAELEQQTIELMHGRSVEPAVFPQRLAFNAVPQVGELLAGGASKEEQQTLHALRRLLKDPHFAASITRVRVPVFFGTTLALNVETAAPLTAAAARAALRNAPGILFDDDADAPRYATPATVVGQDATCVGRIRDDQTGHGLDLWVAIDNIRKGSAVNAVQIAELLIRDYL